MKKIIILLVFVIAFIANADTTIVNTVGLTIVPNNVVSLVLYDGVIDTIADGTKVTFGPYRLVADRNQDAYKGFQFYSGVLGGTTPGAILAYQLASTSDTGNIVSASWVDVDTLTSAGQTGYVDLSSKAAKFIYFRVHNYDATADVMGLLEILYKKDQ